MKFARSFTEYDPCFTPEPPLRRVHKGLRASVKVEKRDVITRIESKELKGENASISGVVLRNPFFNNATKNGEWLEGEELSHFSDPEYLICTLDDWLDAGDEIDHYVLTTLETVRVGGIVLLHPRCTWANITKRADSPKSNGFRKIQAEWIRHKKMLERFKKASKRKNART